MLCLRTLAPHVTATHNHRWRPSTRATRTQPQMSPINAYLGPYLAKVFAPFIGPGFLAFVYGGIEVGRAARRGAIGCALLAFAELSKTDTALQAGQHLTQHPLVSSIHITGSKATLEAILKSRAAASKQVTAELGNFTPCIVVPGPWCVRACVRASGYAGAHRTRTGWL